MTKAVERLTCLRGYKGRTYCNDQTLCISGQAFFDYEIKFITRGVNCVKPA